jgi:putative transposase
MRRLTTLFPSEFLEEHAEELGVVERDRKLQIPAFVWTFVFGFAAGESRTLAGFRRSYNSTADETISPSGFYQRLTPTLAEYLRDLIERGLDEVAVPDAVDADIDRFRDMMIADGTVLRLHEFLSDQFEARHEEQAGAKLHLLHNVTEQTIERIDTADEKTHDSTLFKTGPWLENRLMLFDLAYFKYRRFALIDENDGYFVSRLKKNANPMITSELREWRGATVALAASMRLQRQTHTIFPSVSAPP